MDLMTLLPLIISLIASGGKWAEIAKKALALVQDIIALSQGTADAAQPVNMDARWLQESLKKLGYDPGPIDGDIGSRTHAAVKKFQADNGLEADGWVGVKTQTLLAQKVGAL